MLSINYGTGDSAPTTFQSVLHQHTAHRMALDERALRPADRNFPPSHEHSFIVSQHQSVQNLVNRVNFISRNVIPISFFVPRVCWRSR